MPDHEPAQDWELAELDDVIDADDLDLDDLFAQQYGPQLRPVNWATLNATEAEAEWRRLDEWVSWLRTEYGLPASIVPPLWHRHPELVWELSALHLRWLGSYDPHQDAAAPLAWHVDFHAARHRLAEWVATSGTRLDRDRPTRHTAWPGENPAPPAEETPITDRDDDFDRFVAEDIARRRATEATATHDDT